MLVKPTKANQRGLKRKVKAVLTKLRSATQEVVTQQLASIIQGWANAFRHDNSAEVFDRLDHELWRMLTLRRHPKRGRRWVKQKYLLRIHNRDWNFGCRSREKRQEKKLGNRCFRQELGFTVGDVNQSRVEKSLKPPKQF